MDTELEPLRTELAALRAEIEQLRKEVADLREYIGEVLAMECGITPFEEWHQQREQPKTR